MVGAGEEAEHRADAGTSIDLDDPTVFDLPVRLERPAFAPAHGELDDDMAVLQPLPDGGDAGNATGIDRPRAHVNDRCRLRKLSIASDFIEFHAESPSDEPDRVAEDRRADF